MACTRQKSGEYPALPTACFSPPESETQERKRHVRMAFRAIAVLAVHRFRLLRMRPHSFKRKAMASIASRLHLGAAVKDRIIDTVCEGHAGRVRRVQ
jgi:hypothetical protein